MKIQNLRCEYFFTKMFRSYNIMNLKELSRRSFKKERKKRIYGEVGYLFRCIIRWILLNNEIKFPTDLCLCLSQYLS